MSRMRVAVVVLVSAVGLLAPAAADAVTVGGLRGKTTITVKVKKAWNVQSKRGLVASGKHLHCSVRSISHKPGKPATSAKVACTGPAGSPGLGYTLKLSVRGNSKKHTSKKFRFAQPSFKSVDALLAAAPLPVISGAEIKWNDLDFVQPAGWTRTDFTNAIGLTANHNGDMCQVFVFQPVAVAGNSYTQLHDIVQSLFPDPILGALGDADAYNDERSGKTGFGQSWVGLVETTHDGVTAIESSLTVFAPNFAVPVVKVGISCGYGFEWAAGAAVIELLLSRISQASTLASAYTKSALGTWIATGGSAGVLDAFAANGHYVGAGSSVSTQNIGGELYDVYSSFAGDGNWVAVGPLLAEFPTAAGARASTSVASIFDEVTALPAVHKTHLCELRGDDHRVPYYLCYTKQP
jgi:hypothetical protein